LSRRAVKKDAVFAERKQAQAENALPDILYVTPVTDGIRFPLLNWSVSILFKLC
jgi:hypothetical protein